MNRILSIVQVGHPVLRKPTAELTPEALQTDEIQQFIDDLICLLYTSPSPRDRTRSRMPSSA